MKNGEKVIRMKKVAMSWDGQTPLSELQVHSILS